MTIYTHSLYWIHFLDHTDPYTEGYIGVSKDPGTRLYQHFNTSEKRNDKNPYFGRILNKHKEKIIQTILFVGTEKACYDLEEAMRPDINIGWNANRGGTCPPSKLGWKPKEETLRKRSNSLKGIPRTEEWNKKISIANSGENNGMYGKKMPCSKERALKISQARKNTLEKYRLMTHNEFLTWFNSQRLYRKDGIVNSNVTRAILARNENPDDYYSKRARD